MSESVNIDDVLHTVDRAIFLETGRRVHRSTAIRWTQKGRHGIRLRAVRMGRFIVTSRRAVRDYLCAVTSAEYGPEASLALESPAAKDRRAKSAKKRASESLV